MHRSIFAIVGKTNPQRKLPLAVLLVAALAMAAAVLVSSPAARAEQLPASPNWTVADGTDYTNFGTDVGTAGDVDGDGYSDVVVSCPGYNADDGAALLYCGGPDGLSADPCWIEVGTQDGRQFSNDSFAAGDVNGDGFDDLIIGARGYDFLGQANTFEGAAFVYHGSASGPGGWPDWQVEGEIEDMQLGWEVSTAGDVNADGYDDVLVSSRGAGERVRLYLGSESGLSADWDWSVSGYGARIAAAGDVDADGYDDVLVADAGSNRAYVFFGSPDGPSASPDWTGTGPSGALFGDSVAPAGDVDGDGYADIVIGAPRHGSQETGRAWLFYGSATGPDASVDFAPSGLPADAEFGIDVRTAGDVNADGLADILVGAHHFDGAEPKQGRVYLYLGDVDGLRESPAWWFDGDESNGFLGQAVSGAGDVNADGYGDVVLGAPSASFDDFKEGVAHAFYGSRSGLGEDAFAIRLIGQEEAGYGNHVAYAGDLNGDGLGDVVAGAFRFDGDFADEGTVVVFHGTVTGGGILDYAAQRYGEQAGEYFGIAAGRAGDVNGDGFDDLLVGAPTHDETFLDQGAAYLYYGSLDGIPTAPGWSTFGAADTSWYGYVTTGAGDVDGDGYADVLVGAPLHTNTESRQGALYLYLGSEGGLDPAPSWTIEGDEPSAFLGEAAAGVGDLNGDGFSDVAYSITAYTDAYASEGAVFVHFGSADGPSDEYDWVTYGGQEDARMSRMAAAGDVNGDGYDDLLVGTPFYDAEISQEGRVQLFYGSPTGPGAEPDWTLYGESELGGWLGRNLSTAGDVDRDGYADFVVTEENYDGALNNEGAIYVYLGGPSGPSLGSMHTSGQEDCAFGSSVSTAGDLNGDGFADVIVGAEEYDGAYPDEGALFAYLGSDDARRGGLDIRPRQTTTAGDPIAWLGASDSPSAFGLAAHGRTPMGRESVRLEWQVAASGTPLDGQPVAVSDWTDTGAPVDGLGSAALIEEVVSGLSPETRYHWRVRTRSRSLYTPLTMWSTLAPTGASMTAVRTAGGASSVPTQASVATDVKILGAAPSPMRAGTAVSFRIPEQVRVTMSVHDVAGRRVATLVDGIHPPGTHVVSWSGRNARGGRIPSGLYLVRLKTPAGADARKVWVTR
ncbi:MAG: hypothetical protein GF346_10405 [Candidatus Eisenbacteria bacterium]|nr:hypothetical protein [Candidatus Latescibacterota bacterium]MBD3302847.1 hypothetical protein [Candidatus Eisenbacteria bacterium]